MTGRSEEGGVAAGACLAARAQREAAPVLLADFAMDFRSAQRAVLQLLGTTAPADVPALLHWMRTTRKQSWLEPGGWRLAVGFRLWVPGRGGARHRVARQLLMAAHQVI